MITPRQHDWLVKSVAAARASKHPWPGYAAAETALESNWGRDKIAVLGNNLFGQKRDPSIPASQCIYCDTREEGPHGHWYIEPGVAWPRFATYTDCYDARVALLRRLAGKYPDTYGAALEAKTGEDFITLVSRKWSTWTERGANVLAIYRAHGDVLARIQ